jgi:hypothetical protein
MYFSLPDEKVINQTNFVFIAEVAEILYFSL